MKVLTAAQRQRYETDGYLSPLPALTPEEVAYYRAAVEALEARLGTGPNPASRISECHLNLRWAYDLVTHPAILDAVEDIIGPNILVHSASIFSKPPDEATFVSWHQDGHYWHLSRPRLVSAWIALSESTRENGCLRVIPGTHTARLDHAPVLHADNMLSSGNTVAEGIDEAEAVDLVLQPGEMSFHHVNALHGSSPNRSAGKRIGFAIRYLAPEVSQPTPHYEVLLARGRDDYGHYTVQTEIPSADLEAGYAAQVAFVERLQAMRTAAGRPQG